MPFRVSVLSQPLSPLCRWDDSRSSDSYEGDRSSPHILPARGREANRGRESGRERSQGGFHVVTAQATAYCPDTAHSLRTPPSFSYAPLGHNRICRREIEVEVEEEKDSSCTGGHSMGRRRSGERKASSRTSVASSFVDRSLDECDLDDDDGDDEDNDEEEEEEEEKIDIVIAEQWVGCVHCTADNPPLVLRCEVCHGPLTSTLGRQII